MLATWHAKYAPYGLPTPPNPYELILFYRTAVFESLASGHWWLSPTPERPSIGFGNVAPRAVLWAHLRDSVSRHEFLIFTTHIDHRCTRPMVELCREQFAAFATRGLPLIFAGDFNFNPADANYALLIGDGWRDAHDMVAAPEAATFLYTMPEIPSGRIDHVLYRGETLTPQAWTRLLSPDPKKRLSDHDPVYVRFSLNR
jgi:endonuclease/exonuclease/phosphatase family metal-dependent hydrolase